MNFLVAALNPTQPRAEDPPLVVTEVLTASDTHHQPLPATLPPSAPRGVLPPLFSLSSLPSLNTIPSLPSVPSSHTSTEPPHPLLPLTSDHLQALARTGEDEGQRGGEGTAAPSMLNLAQSGGLQDYIINNDLFK